MRSKNLIILCGIFLALLAIVVIKKFTGPRIPTQEESADIIEQKIDTETLSDLLLKLGKKEIHFVKSENVWLIASQNNIPADAAKIAALIQSLDRLTGEFRSTGEDVLPDYGITDEMGVYLKLHTSGSPDIELVLGTQRPAWRKNFVRRGGKSTVYTTDADILSELGFGGEVAEIAFNVNRWVDMKIANFNPENVQGIMLTKNGQKWIDIAQQDQTTWKSAQGYSFAMDQNRIKNFLQDIARVRGVGIAEENLSVPSPAEWQLDIVLPDNKKVSLNSWKSENAGEYYINFSENQNIFRIPDLVVKALSKTDGDFFADNPLSVDEGTMTELAITDKEEGTKSLSLIKSSVPAEEGKPAEVVWKLSTGELPDKEKIQNLLNQLRSLSLQTLPVDVNQSVNNAMVIGVKNGEQSNLKYQLSKGVSVDPQIEECHLFIIPQDSHNYCVSKQWMENFRKDFLDLKQSLSSPAGKIEKDDKKESAEKEGSLTGEK